RERERERERESNRSSSSPPSYGETQEETLLPLRPPLRHPERRSRRSRDTGKGLFVNVGRPSPPPFPRPLSLEGRQDGARQSEVVRATVPLRMITELCSSISV
ncbi:unnamed protein product, partial [Musa acuminata var. zebrina]